MIIFSDAKDDFNSFLKNYAWWIALILVIIIAAAILIIFLTNNSKKKNKKEAVVVEDSSSWLKALGGKENIIEASASGSRLTLKLNDPQLLDKEEVKNLGVTNIMQMSDKIILVCEDGAEKILKQIQ